MVSVISGVARICCEEGQSWKLCHAALTVDFMAGCSSCSMANSFVTNAVLIERAVSCWHLHQLISQTTQYLDSWLSDLLQSKLKWNCWKSSRHVPQCPIAGDATECNRPACVDVSVLSSFASTTAMRNYSSCSLRLSWSRNRRSTWTKELSGNMYVLLLLSWMQRANAFSRICLSVSLSVHGLSVCLQGRNLLLAGPLFRKKCGAPIIWILSPDCLHPTRTVVIIDILLRTRAAMYTTIAAAAVWQFEATQNRFLYSLIIILIFLACYNVTKNEKLLVLLWGPLLVGAPVRPNMLNMP